jgi:hypothetical protein
MVLFLLKGLAAAVIMPVLDRVVLEAAADWLGSLIAFSA